MGNLEVNLEFLLENPTWKYPKIYPDWWVLTLPKKGVRTSMNNILGRVTAKNKKDALMYAKIKYGNIRGLKVEKLSEEDQKEAIRTVRQLR